MSPAAKHGSSCDWCFTKEELERSPSRADGVEPRKEAVLRKMYCKFLQELGMALKVPQVAIATAIVLCHRFFVRQSHARNDKLTVAASCMYLGAKVEEAPRPGRKIIEKVHMIRYKDAPEMLQKLHSEDYMRAQMEVLTSGEFLVMQTIGFELNIQHPYKTLVTAVRRLKDQGHQRQSAVAQVAWNFVNDGLATTLCLQFTDKQIAAGAIYLAAKFLKVKLSEVWWQDFGVSPRQLEEVSNQLLELYEHNKPKSVAAAQERLASETDSKRTSSGEVASVVTEVKSEAEVKRERPEDCSPDSAVKRKRDEAPPAAEPRKPSSEEVKDAPRAPKLEEIKVPRPEIKVPEPEPVVEEGELPGGSPPRMERQQQFDRRAISPNERRYDRRREFYGRESRYERREREFFYDARPQREMSYRQQQQQQQQQQYRDYYHHHNAYHQEQLHQRQVEWHRPPPPRDGWIERDPKRARHL